MFSEFAGAATWIQSIGCGVESEPPDGWSHTQSLSPDAPVEDPYPISPWKSTTWPAWTVTGIVTPRNWSVWVGAIVELRRVPTETAAGGPCGPCGPCAPLSPFGPWLPGAPCGPVAPVSPFGPWPPVGPWA